jgi:enamine deaminase RidA (YjgF/YER057c/UK114 family)
VDGVLQREGDAYGQTRVAYQVIEKALAQVGYSLEDVVRVRIYLTNEADMDAAGKANGELFADIRPALTILAGVKFINPQMLVEIEVDAYKA